MEENKKEEVNVGETVPESKKVPMGLILTIVLVVILMIGAGVVYGVKSYNAKNAKQMETGKATEKSKTKTETEKEPIVEETTEPTVSSTETFQLKNVDYPSVIKLTTLFYADRFPFQTKDLSFEDAFYEAWFYAREKNLLTTESDISRADLRALMTHLYGDTYSYQDQNIPCHLDDGDLFVFDGTTYRKNGSHGHDGKGFYLMKSYFIDEQKDSSAGTYEMNYQILYGGFCRGTCGGPISKYYKTGNLNETPLYEPSNPEETSYDSVYSEFKDQIPITTFVFKKNHNGYYYLSNVTLKS